MNGALLQSKIWRGYEIAAEKIGFPCQFYRPTVPAGRILQESEIGIGLENGSGDIALEGNVWQYPGKKLCIRRVSLNAEDMKYGKPNKYGKATWYALVDGRDLQVGDYFVNMSGIGLENGWGGIEREDGSGDLLLEPSGSPYFIAAMQPLLPIFVVECNRVVSIYSPQAQAGIGAQEYGGTTTQNQKLLASGVPCSILQGTKGEKSETNLPGDTRSPWFTVLMPAAVGRIAQDDIMTDDLGQRYIVSSNESSDLGYRITAMMADA